MATHFFNTFKLLAGFTWPHGPARYQATGTSLAPTCCSPASAARNERGNGAWTRWSVPWSNWQCFMWVCLKMLCTPLYPMVLLIIIPFLNGYFIGKINPIFRQTHVPISSGAMNVSGAWNKRAILLYSIHMAYFFWLVWKLQWST